MADTEDTRPIHWAGGTFSEMGMGEIDGHQVFAHFTRCGLQVGLDSMRLTDNPDDLSCPDCA